MALPAVIADFETQLSTAVAVGSTTFSIASATDDDGVALPTGLYYFTVDGSSSQKEYLAGTLTGTSVTSVVSVSRQGTETSGAARAHRVGATVVLTDFATYKKYIDNIAVAGAPNASTATAGISKLSTAPVSALDPISVGDNDTRIPTQGENDALAGTAGTPSSSNKYVTNDDTTGTGLIQRASLVAYDLLATGLTSVTVANTTTETTLFTTTIPANTLGTANVVRVKIAVSSLTTQASGTNSVSIRLKYGSTTVATATVGGVSRSQGGHIFADIYANAATNAQVGTIGLGLAGSQGTSPTGGGGVGTATEDSTGALALTITAQWGSFEVNNSITTRGTIVEVLK